MSNSSRLHPQRLLPVPDESTKTTPPISPTEAKESRRPYVIIISGAHLGELHKLGRARTVVGRGASADIQIVDDGVSREHVELVVDGDRVTVKDLGSTNGTYRNGLRVAAEELADGDKVSIGSTTILKFTYQDGIDQHYEQRLYQSALRDGLTHVLKREFFLDRLEGEVAFAMRHSSPVALILWDIDRFKLVNDSFGHPAGDRVLEATATAVARIIRREDFLGRYGGEEFALACRATPLTEALQTAERLRGAIERLVIDLGSASIAVTASFGVACCADPAPANTADLIAAADVAMYRAKALGRNRVEQAHPLITR